MLMNRSVKLGCKILSVRRQLFEVCGLRGMLFYWVLKHAVTVPALPFSLRGMLFYWVLKRSGCRDHLQAGLRGMLFYWVLKPNFHDLAVLDV